MQSIKRTTNDFEGNVLHNQAKIMESPKFPIEVPMTTSVASAFVLQESDSLDGAHPKKFEFDECFYDEPSMVHDQQELTEVRKIEFSPIEGGGRGVTKHQFPI